MQELNFENLGNVEGGIYLSFYVHDLKQSLNDITQKPNIQGSLSSLYDQPKRCIVIVKGKSTQNYHRFAACLVPPRWVPFNDPKTFQGRFPNRLGVMKVLGKIATAALGRELQDVQLGEYECRMLPLAPSNTKGSIRDFCSVFVCCWKKSQDFFGLGVKFKQRRHILRLKTANVFQEKQKEEVFLGLNWWKTTLWYPLRQRHKQPIEALNCCWSSSLLHRDTTQKRQKILDPPELPWELAAWGLCFVEHCFFFESLEQAGKKGLLWWMFRYGFLRAIFAKCRFKTQNWKTFHPQSVQRIAAVSCDHSGRWCMINKWRKSQWESKIPKSSPPNTSKNVPVFTTEDWWWFFFLNSLCFSKAFPKKGLPSVKLYTLED